MSRWNNPSYQKITDARFVDDEVVVTFEDEDVIKIPKESLAAFDITNVEWDKLDFNPFEITFPAKPQPLEIPWDKLRVITDKEFGKYLADKSEEQSKLIGIKVKRLRERHGISGKELAGRAGLTPQTISRIEQGHTDVSFVTLRKILAAMGYTLKDLANQEAEIERENPKKSFPSLMKRLRLAGIDSNLLMKRVVPRHLQSALNSHKGEEPELLLDEVTSYVSAVYGWPQREIWTNPNLAVKADPAMMAFYKKPSNANAIQVRAYSHYAFYLAKIVLKAHTKAAKITFPESLEEFKEAYFSRSLTLELRALLEFAWDLGISVLPLNDSGVFHGASWNIDGKHVIVLKQSAKSHALWIFDLLHELYHVFAHLDEPNSSVVESEELNPLSNTEAVEELEANSFANQFIFAGRAEELAEECVASAKWDLRNLSSAVVKVSKKEGIRADFLANYLAFRLKFQDENWWGAANKLQITHPSAYTIAVELLKERISMDKLGPVDFNLLNAAISNHEESKYAEEV